MILDDISETIGNFAEMLYCNLETPECLFSRGWVSVYYHRKMNILDLLALALFILVIFFIHAIVFLLLINSFVASFCY